MTTFGKRQGGGRRAAAREPVPLLVVLTGRTHSHNAVLVDLSTTGARLRCSELPQVGEDLVLNVEGLAAYGVVRWSRMRHCGLEFDPPISLAQVKSLAHKVSLSRGLPVGVSAALEDWSTGKAR
jgi:hypothetical protein